MNWTWSIRSGDGGMNGLEFCHALTAGGLDRVLVHAAPASMSVEVVADDRSLVATGDVDRSGDYAPMTLLTLDDGRVERREVWPSPDLHGTVVLLAGSEVGILRSWHHEDDRSWWRWTLELSNHTDRPADWSPPDL